ncbi:hypothetical protein HMPREF9098_0344 [Kingella denitrificans ATCC 33394]|uniref:Uncharacterized protein n=1 Tax=Kingella denitrificans ATCC 33394 TaxID=888741 RepID=F0EWW4_9NEIS|nr:hypothetical protein HMPREF9098_0344 [Kingella denitrificans ATCC 33394]
MPKAVFCKGSGRHPPHPPVAANCRIRSNQPRRKQNFRQPEKQPAPRSAIGKIRS